jgi:hypothetical protein
VTAGLSDLLAESEPTVARHDGISDAVERMLTRVDPHRRWSDADAGAPNLMVNGERLYPDGWCQTCDTATRPARTCWWCGGPVKVTGPVELVVPAGLAKVAS